MAREVAARGVRVAIAPGFIESNMTDDAIPENERCHASSSTNGAQIGQAEEVAEVAAFLAGQNI